MQRPSLSRGRAGALTLLLAPLLASLATAPQARAQSPADALARVRAAWVNSLEQQDVETAMGLYEPDAMFVIPDGNRYPDRASIRTLYRSVFGMFRAKITMTSRHQELSTDLCVDDGDYSEAAVEKSTGKNLIIQGHYVMVVRRQQDGSWKIAEVVWTQTSAGPAPGH